MFSAAEKILHGVKQSVSSWLLGLPLLSAYIPTGGRRAKKIHVRTRRLKLDISLRKFRTSPASRSQLHHQIVMPTGGLLPYGEAAITFYRFPTLNFRLARIAVNPAQFLIITGLTGMLIFGLSLSRPTRLTPVAHSLTVKPDQVASAVKSLPASQPTHIQIDKIGVDAAIVPVDLDSSGSLQVPGPDQTGWYQHSPTPGEIGASVIDGHLDYIDRTAVFWRLRELVPGDQININRADGSVASFNVTDIESYPQESFPTGKVYGKVNFPALRLITCGGTFNAATRHYSDNIVVYASLKQ